MSERAPSMRHVVDVLLRSPGRSRLIGNKHMAAILRELTAANV